jgi:hypothetical protein
MTSLESRLRDAGIACRVEVRDRLAILVPDGARPTREERFRAIQLANAEGFSHVCVELADGVVSRDGAGILEPHGATLPGD